MATHPNLIAIITHTKSDIVINKLEILLLYMASPSLSIPKVQKNNIKCSREISKNFDIKKLNLALTIDIF